jgi:predicted phage terminase large subunit-like protein
MEVRLEKIYRQQQLGIPNDYALGRHGLNLYEVTAELCRRSFYDFVLEFWCVLEPTPFTDNWHIQYLCGELQRVAERVIAGKPKEYDLIINISPGSTKSTLISVMLPAWMWTRMAHASVIGASHTYALAVDLSRKNRALVKSEKYRECYPEIKVALDQDAKGFFVNTKGGARFSAGVDGDVTGRHGHLILTDDPINPKGGRSESDTENANIFIKETLANRKKDPLVTPMILIMQRLSENDPTGMMLEEWPDPLKHICLPAEIHDGVVTKPAGLSKFYVDGIMNPHRHPREYLVKERGRGDYYYAGQYLQSPIPLGGAMFHVERFSIERTPPNRWRMRMRYWDKAGTKDSGAYSTGVLMGIDFDGRFWVLDVVRGQWDSNRRERIIRQTADLDTRVVLIGIEQEPGSAGKESAENTVRNLPGFRVRMDRPTGDKAQRADPYSTQVNAGNVYLVRGEWNRAYINELRYFSLKNKKYKDQVDASSGAFKFLSRPVLRAGGWKL